jgi:hypothetical protein
MITSGAANCATFYPPAHASICALDNTSSTVHTHTLQEVTPWTTRIATWTTQTARRRWQSQHQSRSLRSALAEVAAQAHGTVTARLSNSVPGLDAECSPFLGNCFITEPRELVQCLHS